MFSVIFPGQGSQIVGMGKEFYEKFDLVKELFDKADNALNFPLSKIILEGPKEELNLTANTQPAIFLISFSIFQVIKQKFNIDLNKAKFFAGHSLGEYSAMASAGYLDFADTIKILKIRGDAMQNSVPKGQGGMVAVLGINAENMEKILKDNSNNFSVEIANDNSEGQIVLSGKISDLDKLTLFLKEKKIKNIKLPVSAPFHCSLMYNATQIMREELEKLNFKKGCNTLVSNITANEIFNADELKELLVKQIENRVRWRESVINMIDKGVEQFIEIGPGKVLSGLVKRINNKIEVISINSEEDIKNIKI
tara:strand:- start:289 stop:1215 length:927 start_codon:yes stop_codon:yes gene_type:complete